MPALRKALVVSLFVLLSAVLFALLLKPVIFGLANCYARLSFNPPSELWLTTAGIIALAISAALTAGTFLLVALIARRFRQ